MSFDAYRACWRQRPQPGGKCSAQVLKLVLVLAGDQCNADGRMAPMGYGKVAAYCCIDVKTARRALDELCEQGWLRPESDRVAGRVSHYRLGPWFKVEQWRRSDLGKVSGRSGHGAQIDLGMVPRRTSTPSEPSSAHARKDAKAIADEAVEAELRARALFPDRFKGKRER